MAPEMRARDGKVLGRRMNPSHAVRVVAKIAPVMACTTSAATLAWKPSDVVMARVATFPSSAPYARSGSVAAVQPRRSSSTMKL